MLSNRTIAKLMTVETRTVGRITQGKPHHTLLIISLEVFWTRIILLHAHPQVVYCQMCLISIYSSVKEKMRVQDIWTDIAMYFVCRGNNTIN